MQQGLSLSPAELEVALRLVTHFPRGMGVEFLKKINGARAEVLREAIRKMVEGLACCARGATEQAPVPGKLLELVKTISVPAITEFRAAEKFRPGETVDGVEISRSMGTNFRTHFLPKIEENVPATKIRVHKLLRNSKDLNIRAEIGEENEETTLGQLWGSLKLQGCGQDGVLLAKYGFPNIFYIRDVEGNLWAVGVCWFGDGWFLNAYSVGSQNEWFADFRVFSR